MQLSINREALLKAVNLIAKAADRRHNMVILGNIKLVLTPERLVLTASDLEVELKATLKLPEGACIQEGSTTLPAIKLVEICRSIPKDSVINFRSLDHARCLISSGNSKFTLGSLPADDFPLLGSPNEITSINIRLTTLTDLIHKTQFAMAIQDVRYYLTGMLFDIINEQLTTVATDGHRLALARGVITTDSPTQMQAILPRKPVLELQRLLEGMEREIKDEIKKRKLTAEVNSELKFSFGREFLRAEIPFGEFNEMTELGDDLIITLTARLIDGKFPDYKRVIPSSSDKRALLNKDTLSEVLRRVAILSNEKSRGVVFSFAPDGSVEVRANNAEQDEAVEVLQSKYQGEAIELSFNAAYLQDVLSVISGDVQLQMSQSNASVLVNQFGDELHQFVIMPMRL